jgi:chitinase
MLQDTCIDIEDGQPAGEDPCGASGRVFTTYSGSRCRWGKWAPWCCEPEFDSSDCHWRDDSRNLCENSKTCEANYVNMGVSAYGEGENCEVEWGAPDSSGYYSSGRAWCCPAGDQSQFENTSPVPLEWLFIDDTSDDDDVEIHMKVQAAADENQDPNESGFGWVIMTGPEEDLTSLDKRDGSHWELFDCPDRETITEDHRITVRAVCADDSIDSNCHKIFNGGIPRTVVEMPSDCGIGRYAMAVDLVKSQNQTLPPVLIRRLAKRTDAAIKRGAPRVYDFTFDYNFAVLQGRDDSNVQIRIDYSEDPSYWEAIVDNEPGNDPAGTLDKRDRDLRKRQMREEVERDHGGSWKRYAEHTFRKQKRETPSHRMHEVEKRWFAEGDDVVQAWMDAMQALSEHEFGQDVTLGENRIQDTFPFWLFNENLDCEFLGVPYNAYFAAWADLHVDITTSATLTLIVRCAIPRPTKG